ncbi:hypothetical protein E2562_015792 [Oryza meyeriana var. granulata]|uniref:Uncharacterized protein n=1 Tax=Oryza meyeriana var. granulata TaxID=110450 RepID=A0A6G1D4E2_9ORYZ|nr:hypothetical protein E2562_015792 [Oryza meyeriana var. granulata]
MMLMSISVMEWRIQQHDINGATVIFEEVAIICQEPDMNDVGNAIELNYVVIGSHGDIDGCTNDANSEAGMSAMAPSSSDVSSDDELKHIISDSHWMMSVEHYHADGCAKLDYVTIGSHENRWHQWLMKVRSLPTKGIRAKASPVAMIGMRMAPVVLV